MRDMNDDKLKCPYNHKDRCYETPCDMEDCYYRMVLLMNDYPDFKKETEK